MDPNSESARSTACTLPALSNSTQSNFGPSTTARGNWQRRRASIADNTRRVPTLSLVAKELGVGRRCLYKWQAKLDHLEPGEEAPRTNSHESSYRQQVHRLKRLLAEKTLEVDFFKGALQKVKARRQKSGDSGEMASTTKSEK